MATAATLRSTEKSDLLKLCPSTDVTEGKPVPVTTEEYPPLAVYRVENDFFVTANICTHGLALLSEGFQEGFEIECPFHGGAFDIRTGAAISFPCELPITTFPALVVDGFVCIRRNDSK